MRLYSASSEGTLQARKLLADWAGEGLLTKEQYQRLEQETVSELRTTNIFLRLILFLFTAICVGAAAGLFFEVLSHPSDETTGVFLVMFAVVCYAAAEIAASRARLYRYGIEEGFAVCAVAFLCIGLELAFFTHHYSSGPYVPESVVPAAGAMLSLWIWHRFGLWYAFVAAMIFTIFLPGFWTSSHPSQHVAVAGLYAAGLIGVIAVRPRHRFDYVDTSYSLAEALLWLGIYLAINLQLSALEPLRRWWGLGEATAAEFGKSFYWATWVLIWLLPVVVLARGLRRKDRSVIQVGGIIAVLTFLSNKAYLGWARHTWDPMILGVLLAAAALLVRRWLDQGTHGTRYGFTAARLSGKDKQWMDAGSAVLGLAAAQSVTPSPQPRSVGASFGGGSSGGGGASGEF